MFIFSPIVRFIPSPRGGEGSSYSSERSFVWRRRVVYGNFVWSECVYLYRKTIRSIETLLSRRNQFDGAVLHRRACRTWYWRQLELPAGERQTTVKAAKQYFSFVLFLCLKLLSGLGKIGNVIYREFLFQRNRREIFLCSRVYCLETVIHLFQMLAWTLELPQWSKLPIYNFFFVRNFTNLKQYTFRDLSELSRNVNWLLKGIWLLKKNKLLTVNLLYS